MSLSIKNTIRTTATANAQPAARAESLQKPTTRPVNAPVDGFAAAPTGTGVRSEIQKQLAKGLELTGDLQGLAKSLERFQPQSVQDVNLLKSAYAAVDAFKPEDGAQLNTRAGMLESLGITLMRNVGRFEIAGFVDLSLLNKVVAGFQPQDGADVNAVRALREKVTQFQPQDGAELHTREALLETIASRLPANDAADQLSGLVSDGLKNANALFELTRLLSDFAPTNSAQVDLLKSAFVAAQAFQPEDGADVNAKAGAIDALQLAILRNAPKYSLETTQDLSVLANVLKGFEPQDGSDVHMLESFAFALKRFEPQDGAQLNMRAALIQQINAMLHFA